MAKRTKKIDQKKAIAAIRAIHDVLFLDTNDGDLAFHNGAKEWSVDMLETIADAVGTVIPRPPDAEVCEECGNLIPVVKGGGLANRHHDRSCSLYDAKRD